MSHIFILSGAEDLVPVLVQVDGEWKREKLLSRIIDGVNYSIRPSRIIDGVNYSIQRYRPRIEGLFARIERWTNLSTGEVHWRSISKDNIATLYGKTAESRIADPRIRNVSLAG